MGIVSSEPSDEQISEDLLYNHVCAKLSELDMQVIRSVRPGGNWKDIPSSIIQKSARLRQIQASGGRTTYYGRLSKNLPSYTINTYFNRPGNGTFIHPEQDRLISMREAARLQSFPDSYRFLGSTTSMYKQMAKDMDINCGAIIDGDMTISEMGELIFHTILETASGKKTKSEVLGFGNHEFVPWHIGAVM